MIHRIILCFVTLAIAGAMQSCRDLPENGEFSGQWQVLTMEYPDGTNTDPQGKLYYRFYRTVAQLAKTPAYVYITGNLSYQKGKSFSIQIFNPRPEELEQFGIIPPEDVTQETESWTTTFTIQSLSEEHLQFTTEAGVKISCRKY